MGGGREHREKITVLNLIQRMEKNNFNFEKRAFFWERSSIAPYINVTRMHKMLIYFVKLDHALYNYSINCNSNTCFAGCYCAERSG